MIEILVGFLFLASVCGAFAALIFMAEKFGDIVLNVFLVIIGIPTLILASYIFGAIIINIFGH